MNETTVKPEEHEEHHVTHHKPRHIAEKLERYIGIIAAVVAGIMIVGVLIAFSQTGNDTPSWMR